MVCVDACVVIAGKFSDIHQVKSAEAIKIGWVAGVDDKQREGQAASKITGIEINICKTKRRDVTAFVHIEMQRVGIILTAVESFYTPRILHRDDGVFIYDVGAGCLVLKELLMGSPAEGRGHFTGSDLLYGIGLVAEWFVNI